MLSRSVHPPWTERRGSRPGSCLYCRRRPSWSLMSESFDHWQIMWLQFPCRGSFACGWWRGIGSLGSRSGSGTCHKRTQIVNKELHSTSLTRLKKPKIFLPLLLSFRWKWSCMPTHTSHGIVWLTWSGRGSTRSPGPAQRLLEFYLGSSVGFYRPVPFYPLYE